MQLSQRLRPGQQAFQFATQIAILEFDTELRSIIDKAGFTNDEARGLARIGWRITSPVRWYCPTRRF